MKNTNRLSWVINSIFWIILGAIIFIAVFFSRQKHDFNDYLINLLVFGVINLSVYYINYTILITELIQKRKKYGLYILSFIILLLISTAIKYLIAILNPDQTLRYQVDGKEMNLSHITFVINAVFSAGFLLVSSTIIRFVIYWYENENREKTLISEKKDMELQFLKSQLNPHFLFNSLNNIYSLAYQKSEKTADAILKLSEIMRYMIYESNDRMVSLDKEVEYLQNFIELQRLRFKDGAAIEIHIQGEIDGQQIVPLILIALVENAFKHGVANDKSDPIKINLIANKEIVHFSVHNKKSKANKDAVGGVGLNNVERRLQLLYPEKHKLNIKNTETHYSTELILDL